LLILDTTASSHKYHIKTTYYQTTLGNINSQHKHRRIIYIARMARLQTDFNNLFNEQFWCDFYYELSVDMFTFWEFWSGHKLYFINQICFDKVFN